MQSGFRLQPLLALLAILLLLLAPEPGERADDPADASAEIARARAGVQRVASDLDAGAPPIAWGSWYVTSWPLAGSSLEPVWPPPSLANKPSPILPLSSRPPPA